MRPASFSRSLKCACWTGGRKTRRALPGATLSQLAALEIAAMPRGDGDFQGLASAAADGLDHARLEGRLQSVTRGALVQVSSRCWPRRLDSKGWHPFAASLASSEKR